MGCYSIDRDSNVFVNKENRVVINLYVHDILFLSLCLQQINKTKADLAYHYKVKGFGKAEYCLGIKITRDRVKRTINISQRASIPTILR